MFPALFSCTPRNSPAVSKCCSCHPHPACRSFSCIFHYSSPGTSWEILNETFPQPLFLHFADGIMRPSWEETSPALPITSHSLAFLPCCMLGIYPGSQQSPWQRQLSATMLFYFLFFWLERIPARLFSGILGNDCSLINPAAIPPSLPALELLKPLSERFQNYPKPSQGDFPAWFIFPQNPELEVSCFHLSSDVLIKEKRDLRGDAAH